MLLSGVAVRGLSERTLKSVDVKKVHVLWVDLSPIYRKLLFAIYLIQINSITYNFIFFSIYTKSLVAPLDK